MRILRSLALVLFIAAAVPGPQSLTAQTPPERTPAALAAVSAQALHSHGYEYLEQLCDSIGGRLTGSPQDRAARLWALGKMNSIGLKNVHQETWQLARGWRRISARAEMRAPGRQILTVSSLGWAGSTRAGGAEAGIVAVNRNDLAGEQEQSARWKGKILFLDSKGTSPGSVEIFARMVPFLRQAHAAGAVAVIDGQGTPESQGMNLTHVDPADLAGGYVDIPVVRMAAESRALIQRLLERRQTVRVWLEVRNQTTAGPVTSANVMGEIPGALHADQIVVVGAHLDSWDLGQGATDDGFGSAVVLAAAEAIANSGFRPDRTLRFVLFTGEEQGIKGSQAYVRAHRKELRNHAAAVVADMGDGPPNAFWLNGRNDLLAPLAEVAPLLAPGIRITDSVYTFSDAFSFTLAGLPGIDLGQASPDYKYTHHSSVDTFDKVRPEDLVRSTAAVAVLAFWIADRERLLSDPLTSEETRRLMTKLKLNGMLKLLDLKPAAAE